MSQTLFGYSSTSGTQGPRGYPGRGISTVSVSGSTLTFTYTDSTTSSVIVPEFDPTQNINITGANNASKFSVANNSSTTIFDVNTSNGAVSSKNNVLDDGSSNASIAGNLIVSGNIGSYTSPTGIIYTSSVYCGGNFTSYDIHDPSAGSLTFFRGFTATDSALNNVLVLSGANSNVQISGTNSTSKFNVQNNSSTTLFNVNSTTGAVTTKSNTLDDGSGNVILANGPSSTCFVKLNSSNQVTYDTNTYLTTASISGYLTTSSASSTYQTISGMSSYLTTSTAASTYLPLTGGTTTGAVTISQNVSSASNFLTLNNTSTGNTSLVILTGTTGAYMTQQGSSPYNCQFYGGGAQNLFQFLKNLLVSGSGGTASTTAFQVQNTSGTAVFTVDNTTPAVTVASSFSQTGANTFSTGTGAISLNGATSVTGTNTFSTGTGAVSLNGAVSLASAISIASGYQSTAGPYINLTSTNTGTTNTLLSLNNNSNTAALTAGMISLTNTTAFGNTFINLVSGTATASTSTIQMSCGNGTTSQMGTILLTGATPVFTLNRAVTLGTNTLASGAITSTGLVTGVGLAAGTGTLTGTGAWTVTTGLLTSTAAGTAGSNSVRLALTNTTNSATSGTTVGVSWTATNAAGTAQQTGNSFYGPTGWTFQVPAATGVNNVLTLSNTQATAGAGTQLTFQGYTTSAQTATLGYNGSNFIVNTSILPSASYTYNLGGSGNPFSYVYASFFNSVWYDGVNTRGMLANWTGYSSSYAWSFAAQGSFGPNAYMFGSQIIPSADNSYTCGNASNRWSTIYAATSTINTSDSRTKTNIQPVSSSMGLTFINQLNPVSYTRIDGHNGRTHYGLIAQDIQTVLTNNSLTGENFAGYIYGTFPTGEGLTLPNGTVLSDYYGLRYEEFIAPMIKAIQDLSALVTTLQTTVATQATQITTLNAHVGI